MAGLSSIEFVGKTFATAAIYREAKRISEKYSKQYLLVMALADVGCLGMPLCMAAFDFLLGRSSPDVWFLPLVTRSDSPGYLKWHSTESFFQDAV